MHIVYTQSSDYTALGRAGLVRRAASTVDAENIALGQISCQTCLAEGAQACDARVFGWIGEELVR